MANVQIIFAAHAMISGARGTAGGAPSKDSIVGVALVQGNVVSFGGRRGGVLRYKTYLKANLAQVLAKFESKLTGNPFGKNVVGCYTKIEESAFDMLVPDLTNTVCRGFYKAMANKKLNTRSTKKQA